MSNNWAEIKWWYNRLLHNQWNMMYINNFDNWVSAYNEVEDKIIHGVTTNVYMYA